MSDNLPKEKDDTKTENGLAELLDRLSIYLLGAAGQSEEPKMFEKSSKESESRLGLLKLCLDSDTVEHFAHQIETDPVQRSFWEILHREIATYWLEIDETKRREVANNEETFLTTFMYRFIKPVLLNDTFNAVINVFCEKFPKFQEDNCEALLSDVRLFNRYNQIFSNTKIMRDLMTAMKQYNDEDIIVEKFTEIIHADDFNWKMLDFLNISQEVFCSVLLDIPIGRKGDRITNK